MEYDYKGLDELPSRTIQAMMESSVIEIARLQRELDSSNSEVKQLHKKLEQLQSADTVTKKNGE